MSKSFLLFLRVLLLATAAIGSNAVADTADPHIDLENIDSKASLDWAREQNARSLAELEKQPEFAAMRREALEILTSEARIPYGDVRGDHVFNFWQDKSHVRGILRRSSLASYAAGKPDWETLLDVDALDASEKENWVYQSVECLAPDYLTCLIELSRGGTDASVYREFSIAQGRFVADGFVIPEAKSSVDWIDQDHLLVATDWGPDSLTESGYAKTLKIVERGKPLAEAKTVYTAQSTDVSVQPLVRRDRHRTYPFLLRAITFFNYEYFLIGDDGALIALPLPQRAGLEGVVDGRAIVRLNEQWKYKGETYPQGALVALAISDMSAELVYAPGKSEALRSVGVGSDAVFIGILDNVVGAARRLTRDADGWRSQDIPLPENGVVSLISVNPKGDDLLVSFESLTTPDTLYYVGADNKPSRVFGLPEMYDASDVLVSQRFATSRDGTRIPYFVMGKKAVLERGNAPTVQYGYGGFLISILPYYYEDPSRPQHGALAGRLWVSRGGVLVLSNIRGGGEYGPGWHEAALKHNRQRSFDDFFAISEDLIASGVTTPQRLGAIGRSNGGLLMGVALTQRPDLYAAIDCGVPLLDMLRYDKLLAGASWVGEYGDPDLPADREIIMTYSPYQKLEKDREYPEVFFYTSTKDDRVHPGHARKMAARMAAWNHPFLYYENIEGGHGGTANQEQLAFRTALEYAYFARRLMPKDGN
ncbi:MAG: prolyl oligopeptidase family serine peptidase [Chromatiales bacterium]|nr:prolyl oligopeptidase family serine peptidase [Chromatiales bacterium]MDH4014619.1 prolyl oligopeptidase family serine peptidase [Chromatiales bacterium]